MFWWWQVVDEQNLYPRYRAVSEFMKDVDPRDPTIVQANTKLDLTNPETGNKELLKQFGAICVASPTTGRGYIYAVKFTNKEEDALQAEGLKIFIEGIQSGLYRVAFHETSTGRQLRRFDVRAEDGYIGIPVPAFKKDIAFKLNCITAVVSGK